MTFVNNQAYERDHDFSLVELAPLTPADIKGGCVEAYGTQSLAPKRSQPMLATTASSFGRSLFLHANKLMAWNAISGQGNPTRSIEVNKLVKAVQKKESENKGTVNDSTFDDD
jgi:hypothetical protein